MTERVALDANVLDWLLGDPVNLAVLLDLRNQQVLEPIVTAEVAHEIYRMPDRKAAKRDSLQRLILNHFKPVKPTFVPITGLARCGLAYIATPRTEGFLAAVRQRGLRKLDALHVTNAHFHRCVAFLTQGRWALEEAAGHSGPHSSEAGAARGPSAVDRAERRVTRPVRLRGSRAERKFTGAASPPAWPD